MGQEIGSVAVVGLGDLQASRNPDRATLEFDLEVLGRIAVVLTQAELHSLYQHILSEADAGILHLSFSRKLRGDIHRPDLSTSC